MECAIKSFDELPLMLKVEDAARVLGVSRGTALSLTKQPGFPAIRVGPKRIVIPRDKFVDWIDNQSERPLPLLSYSR